MIIIKYNLFHTHYHFTPIPSTVAQDKLASGKAYSIIVIEETFEKKKIKEDLSLRKLFSKAKLPLCFAQDKLYAEHFRKKLRNLLKISKM